MSKHGTPTPHTIVLPFISWISPQGDVVPAPLGHFKAASKILGELGRGYEIANDVECYYSDADDADQFNLRDHVYGLLHDLGWFRCVRQNGTAIHVDSDHHGEGRIPWAQVPRCVRTIVEDAAFHYSIAVKFDGRDVVEVPVR